MPWEQIDLVHSVSPIQFPKHSCYETSCQFVWLSRTTGRWSIYLGFAANEKRCNMINFSVRFIIRWVNHWSTFHWQSGRNVSFRETGKKLVRLFHFHWVFKCSHQWKSMYFASSCLNWWSGALLIGRVPVHISRLCSKRICNKTESLRGIRERYSFSNLFSWHIRRFLFICIGAVCLHVIFFWPLTWVDLLILPFLTPVSVISTL